MNILRMFGVGIGATITIIACSSGTNNGGTGSGDAQSFINDLCGTIAPCCASINKPTDGQACRSLYGAFTGASTYDASSGAACLNQLHSAQSSADFCTTFTQKGTSCKAAFKESGSANGTVALGATCSADGDCMADAEGDVSCTSTFSGNAETKTCQVNIHGKEGDMPCTETRDGTTTSFGGSSSTGTTPPPKVYYCDVADGLFCASAATVGTTSSPAKCTKIQSAGGACDNFSSEGCTKDSYCDFSTKKCTARVALGGDCSKSTTSCALMTYCTTDTHKCTMQLDTGAPCKTSPECVSKSCVNTKCAASSSDATFSLQFYCGGN